MYELTGIQALHEEVEYFDYAESIKDVLPAMLILRDSVRAVQAVMLRAKQARDSIVELNASRIIQRLRDEMFYRTEICIHTSVLEALRTLHGEDVAVQVLMHHRQSVEHKRSRLPAQQVLPSANFPKLNAGWIDRIKQVKALSHTDAFFHVARTTPDLLEGLDMCRRAVHAVKRIQIEALADQLPDVALQCTLMTLTLKEEIRCIAELHGSSALKHSLKPVLGHDRRMEVIRWTELHSPIIEVEQINLQGRVSLRRAG